MFICKMNKRLKEKLKKLTLPVNVYNTLILHCVAACQIYSQNFMRSIQPHIQNKYELNTEDYFYLSFLFYIKKYQPAG